jgi:hypothetical protein
LADGGEASLQQSDALLGRRRDAGVITKASLAELYRVSENDILEVTFSESADSLKISVKRWVSSEAPGDTDVFGAQQHVPLMSLSFKLVK